MRTITLVTLLLSGCTLQIDGGNPTDVDIQTSFNTVINRTGATIVLVDRDEWDFEDNFWSKECADDILDLSISVEDNTLIISSDDLGVHEDCRVKIKEEDVEEVECEGDGDLEHEGTMYSLSSIRVVGNGDVDIDGIKVDRLSIEARGNGQVNIADIDATSVFLDMTGTSDVFLSGVADEGEFYVGGVGNLEARDLILQDLYIEVTGEGNATVTVQSNIDGLLSGSGNLDIYGGAQGKVDDIGSGVVNVLDDPN